MTCVELQRSLSESDELDSAEHQDHLKACPRCSALVKELALIVSAASSLAAEVDPSPRVWNSIEAALRKEGLIRPRPAAHSLIPAIGTRWGWARWAAPLAAALLVLVGVYVNQHSLVHQLANDTATSNAAPVSEASLAGLNDDDFVQEVSWQTPAIKAQYAENLRRANDYIRDAQADVDANPNDEEARRALMEAYQQKSMLFEMAMEPSLP